MSPVCLMTQVCPVFADAFYPCGFGLAEGWVNIYFHMSPVCLLTQVCPVFSNVFYPWHAGWV